MTPQDFDILHADTESDVVKFHGYDGRQIVNGFVPTMALDDHFRRAPLTDKQAKLVAESNRIAIARIICRKYERGEWTTYNRLGTTMRRVDVTLADLDHSGEKLSDSVVAMAARSAGWGRTAR